MITYKATNTQNGKFYIGSTTDFTRRKKQHLQSNSNYPFHRDLRNNPDAFEWEVWSDESSDRVLEQALLDMWCGTQQCYNLSTDATAPGLGSAAKGGKRTHELHPEVMSNNGKVTGSKNLLKWQKDNPEEFKECVKRASAIGHEKHKGKHSEWGKLGAKNGGASTAKLKSKPVMCVETGIVYTSINDAARQLKIGKAGISRCCRGLIKTTHNHTWRFL